MPIHNPPGARTRKLIVPIQHAFNHTDAADIHIDAVARSIRLPNVKLCRMTSYFAVPMDYLSDMTVKFLLVPNAAAGNVYLRTVVAYGACGEDWASQEDTAGFTAIAIANDTNWHCVQSVAMTAPAAGDIVLTSTARDAANALDTLEASIYAAGWLIEYTADM